MSIARIGWTLKQYLPRRLFLMARSSFFNIRTVFRAQHRRRASAVSAAMLTRQLMDGGVRSGDLIMVHSSLSNIGNVERGPETILESLRAAVGDSGTILMPCFVSAEDYQNKLARGEVIDLRAQRSQTGTITEAFRTSPGVLCSSHPFSAVCAWGKRAEYLVAAHETDPRICHKDSPIGRLNQLDGKIVGLGVTLGPISFYHVLEDTWPGFPILTYAPAFNGVYLDWKGERISRTVMRYDSKIAATRIDNPQGDWIRNTLERHLEFRGIVKRFRYGKSLSFWMKTGELFAELQRLAAQGITIYTTEEDWKKRRVSSSLEEDSPFMRTWERRTGRQ